MIQEHMPVVRLGEERLQAGIECDYCDEPAAWFHWAVRQTRLDVNRDAYACGQHVGYLNRYTRWFEL
jgi:hypothetical protein